MTPPTEAMVMDDDMTTKRIAASLGMGDLEVFSRTVAV